MSYYHNREEVIRRMQQFMVHSYIYYVLDDNIISDYQYDYLCRRLVELLDMHPEAKELPYYDICRQVGADASGSFIKEYPPQIITTAFRVLWLDKKENPHFQENFEQFIGRWGRTLER